MKKQTLGTILGIGTALIGGCGLQKKAYDQTQLYYDPSGKNYKISIRAVDFDGIRKIYLFDEEEKVLFSQSPGNSYIPHPTSSLVCAEADRANSNIFLDDQVKKNEGKIPDGAYTVEVTDIKGNSFRKRFTKEKNRIIRP